MDIGLDYTEPNTSETVIQEAENFALSNTDSVVGFLKEFVSSEVTSFTPSYLSRKTYYSEATITGFLSGCAKKEKITAFIKIRCPQCATDHGTYYYKSNIPDDQTTCFSCESTIRFQDKSTWNVRYTFENRPDR